MRHVRQPALGVDRVDRLLQRHAARDLLLDEEPDHLALVRGLDLLRHDHLDALRALARLQRARDLVVVRDRDRAQAALLRRLEQHVHRRGAVGRVVGVHVQVAVDELAAAEPARDRGPVGRRAVAAGEHVAGRSRSTSSTTRSQPISGPALETAAPQLEQQVAVRHEPRELRAQHLGVARLEQQPLGAVVQHLLVDRDPRSDRHRAGRDRLHHGRGAGRDAGRRRAQRVRPREQRLERLAPRSRQPHALTQRAGQPGGQVDARRRPDRRAPLAVQRQPAQRAQEQPQRRALLLEHERDLQRAVRAVARREALQVDAGSHDRVVAGEEARDQPARDVEGRQPGVEAAEEQLDEPARHLRRQHALGRGVEAAHVQRARVAQRRRRRAGRERLVHVHEVERRERRAAGRSRGSRRAAATRGRRAARE